MRETWVRVRQHMVIGFLFIMPVLITVAVLGRFWKDMLRVGGAFAVLLRVGTILGPSGNAVLAIIFFLILCIIAGYLVRVSFLKRISERIDRQLNDIIPGYSQLRSQTTKKIGVEEDHEPLFEACLVRVQDLWQPGYIVEQNPGGTQTVFVPQAPAFTVGQVYVVDADRIRKLDMDSAALNARLKQLGKGIMDQALLPGGQRG
jgi:uncharacterized membrane protein